MSAVNAARKKNLLLCFDAFGTLFTPSVPVPKAYAAAARCHGILCGDPNDPEAVATVTRRFKDSFKQESKRHPNYGKATGLGAEKWWGNIIHNTFTSFLTPGQGFPPGLVAELLKRYSTKEGYQLYPDVIPFFEMLRKQKSRQADPSPWPWDNTVVGIITNSDDRVPGILESFGLKIGPRRLGSAEQRRRNGRLDDDISFTVLSYDVGVEKPDGRMFEAATDLLTATLIINGSDLEADDFQRLHVGDDVEKDYKGAEAAGWDSVLLRREGGKGYSKEDESGVRGNDNELIETMEIAQGRVVTARSLWALCSFPRTDKIDQINRKPE